MCILTKLYSFNSCILTYCQSMSNLQSRGLESIKSSLTALESLAAEAANRPYIYYGLAKYLMALKRSEAEVVEVIEKGLAAVKEVGERKNEWPFELLSQIFKENQQVRVSYINHSNHPITGHLNTGFI